MVFSFDVICSGCFSGNSSCMHASARMCGYIWRPVDNLRCCSTDTNHLFSATRSLFGLELIRLARWLSSKPWESSWLCLHRAGITNTYNPVKRASYPLKLELQAVEIKPGFSVRAGSVLNHGTFSQASCLKPQKMFSPAESCALKRKLTHQRYRMS